MNLKLVTAALLLSSVALAASDHHSHYAGEQNRSIKSLSAEDVSQLEAGQGWGLAKAAELNGIPGPRHVLDMASEIHLTDKQISAIEAIFTDMQQQAQSLGAEYVQLERQLNQAFANEQIDSQSLNTQLQAIAAVRAKLRFVHLNAHLQTKPILSDEQVKLYNMLRGYTDDPCGKVPEGHDATMWKLHNGCN